MLGWCQDTRKIMTMMHTTCPSCHAVFRIKPEQLDAHAGKVRCGKCAYVFNGFETLITPIETVSFMAPYDEDDEDEEIVQAAPRKLEKFPLDSRTTASRIHRDIQRKTDYGHGIFVGFISTPDR